MESVGLIGYKEVANYLFGKPDLYFLFLMTPITKEICFDSFELSDAF